MAKIKNYLGRDFKKRRSDDKLSKARRSNLMSKIRSKGTKFEAEFIEDLRRSTRRKFTTNVRGLRGTPDIVFDRYKLCIFLDSDFWHGWQYPRWKHLLKDGFWREKIKSNRARDKRNTAFLRRKEWRVLRFWEHQLKEKKGEIIAKIIEILANK